jgi:carbon monoxide dehydrogenase subunit G
MRDFKKSIDITAPPARVWTIMRDVERWHEWTPSITSVELLDPAGLALGARARVRQPKLATAEFRVTALDEGRRFTWVTQHPGIVATADHLVEPTATGSRATLSLRFDGPLGGAIGWLYKGITERYLTLEANGLKALAERTTG